MKQSDLLKDRLKLFDVKSFDSAGVIKAMKNICFMAGKMTGGTGRRNPKRRRDRIFE